MENRRMQTSPLQAVYTQKQFFKQEEEIGYPA